jgi:hypothetical protein
VALIRKCGTCERWKHHTKFLAYGVICADCEQKAAWDRSLAEADAEDAEMARHIGKYKVEGTRHFDMGKAWQSRVRQAEQAEALNRVAAEVRQVMLGEGVHLIMAGERPEAIDAQGWRVVQQFAAGKGAQDIAREEHLTVADVETLERATMTVIVAMAKDAVQKAETRVEPSLN